MPNPSGPNAYPSGPLAYPSAPNLWTGSAGLSSSSTLTASAVKVRPAAAALAASSTLTLTSVNQAVASASLSSSSTLTAVTFANRPAAAALSSPSVGPGPNSTNVAVIAIALLSSSTLAATATVTPESSAAMTSSSALYALSSQSSDITLVSPSTLTALARLAAQGSAALASPSSLTATPRLAARGTATLASTSALTSSARGTFGAAATLASTSALFSTTGTRVDVSSALSSTSSLTATSGLRAVATALLASSSLVAVPTAAVSSPGGPGNLTPSDLVAVPQTKVPTQQLLVADTLTGRIVFDLPYTSLSWSSPLNKAGQASANVIVEAALEGIYAQGVAEPRDALREVLLGPYRYSLVVTYGNEALFAGPYLPSDDLGDNQTIAIGAAGIETILDKRLLNGSVIGVGTGELSDASRDVSFTTNPAGAIYKIASHAVSTGGGAYPNRTLPLYCQSIPDQTGIEQFTYLSYDQLTAWKAITDLVARDDGPDVRVEPFLAAGSDGYYVRWNLEIGNPGLTGRGVPGPDGPLPWTWDDDTSRITRSIDAQGMATTFVTAGSGQDRAKLMVSASTDQLTYWGFPVLERVDTAANSETSTRKLTARVNAFATAHELPTDSWKLKVPVDGDPALGQFRRGDVARIESRNHLLIEPGTYLRRITEVAGDGSGWASVTCDHEDGIS